MEEIKQFTKSTERKFEEPEMAILNISRKKTRKLYWESHIQSWKSTDGKRFDHGFSSEAEKWAWYKFGKWYSWKNYYQSVETIETEKAKLRPNSKLER